MSFSLTVTFSNTINLSLLLLLPVDVTISHFDCHCNSQCQYHSIVTPYHCYCLCHCGSYCLGVNIASAGVCQIQKYISKSEFSKKIVIFRGQMMPYILLMKTIKRREEKGVQILIAITILKDRFTDFECTTSSTPSIRVHRCVCLTMEPSFLHETFEPFLISTCY